VNSDHVLLKINCVGLINKLEFVSTDCLIANIPISRVSLGNLL